MNHQAPKFHRSFLGLAQNKTDVSYWDITLDAYNKKEYKASFYALLDYINPQLRKKFGNADQNYFEIPHGSIVIKIQLLEDQIEIHAPFLQLPSTNVVPILRKTAEINFSPLNLATIRLREEHLEFYFQCKLSTCEPYKMYYVLQEICHTGDTYDDYFTVRYGATSLQKPMIVPYSAQQAQQAWNYTYSYIDEALGYVNYFDSKRWYEMSYDILVIALLKIDYYASPQGHTRNEIEEAITYIRSQNTVYDKTHNCKNILLKIKERGKEAFITDLYQSEIFIPYKSTLPLSRIQDTWKDEFQRALKELDKNDHMSATLTIMFNFLYTFYNHFLPENVHSLMVNAMEKASGKTWNESSKILFEAMKDIMNGNIQTISKRKGFLASLFGN